jgi:membrane-bound lytic murein transglycosylase D
VPRRRKSCWLLIIVLLFLTGCATLSKQPSTPPVITNDTLAQGRQVLPSASGDVDPLSSRDGCDAQGSVSTKHRQVLVDEALEFCQAAQEFWQKGDLENALEALDQAYSLVLQANGDEDPKMTQQKEDLRFLIAKRIMEIYASRHIVVNGQHDAIPLVLNDHVKAEIESLTGRERAFFIASLKRSGRYRPRIVESLREAGLPEELSWLPLIESGFKANALSRARALGLWQFIPSTGYKFGLKRDVYIDERLDPEKSTAAAIAYLKELHSIFGDWTTVLAAYNCGEGRVLRTIRAQNVNYLDNFWDLYERLPSETARYVPRFLATLHILKNAQAYELANVIPDTPLAYETVVVSRQVHLKDIAKAVSVDEEILRELNPELRYRIVPGEEYALKIPPGSAAPLLAALEALPVSTPKPPQPTVVYHRVRKGETLSTIARRYHTSVSALMRVNGLRRSNHIVAGRSLKVPARGAVAVAVASATHDRPISRAVTTRHTVGSGDSLWILARRYGTTVPKIMAANNLSNHKLSVGQQLAIPTSADTPASLKTYSVRRGDTPFMIAKRFKMPLESLLRINRLTPRCTIYPGQTLKVQ